MSAKQQFTEKVRELIREARALSPAVRRNVMELLDEARKRIVGEIVSINPQSYQASQLRTLAKAIDRAMDDFRQELTKVVNADQAKAFDLGEAQVAEPLAAAGVPVGGNAGLSSSALAIAQGYTADLIGGLSKDASGKLNAAIQRALLGGQPMTEIIDQVGRAINNGKSFDGLFSPIGERAVSIATNEILRVHSIAGQARLEDLQQQVPELKKKWIHVPAARVPRPTHIEANGQVRDVNEDFSVGGEALAFPRDPKGSPENTINCHCVMVPEVGADALTPTAGQSQLLKDLGLEIAVTPLAA